MHVVFQSCLKYKEYIIACALCLLMFFNQFYMHYEVFISNYSFEWHFVPFFYWWMDVMVSLLFFYLCAFGNRKIAFILTYIFLLVFVLANVIYSRFFSQYMTLGILNETANFQGDWWLQYVPQAFRWSDILIVITTILFGYGVSLLPKKRTYKDLIAIALIIIASCAIYTIRWSRHWNTEEGMAEWNKEIDFGHDFQGQFICNQEGVIVNTGILKTQVYCNIVRGIQDNELTDQEISEINNYLQKRKGNLSELQDSCMVQGKPNIILLVVESYMSVASQIEINGKEVTPNINSLAREADNYSNYEVISNRGSGVSSDAQVSYFTGLLPLKSEVSVLHIVKNEIISFPKLLQEQKGYNTYITLPTGRYFWHQNEANQKYGIENVIEAGNSQNDFWCDDDKLFEILEQEEQNLQQPYLNVVLTLSMHGGYKEDFLESKNIKSEFDYPSDYTIDYCHYLDKCYFTDCQIGKYIKYLKESGQYDNSVIIICSDHEVPSEYLRIDNQPKNLPLIIANTHIPSDRFYHGQINQIDVFPTLLDMFGLDTEWRGIGKSLLREKIDCTTTAEDRHISDKILLGNFFGNKAFDREK